MAEHEQKHTARAHQAAAEHRNPLADQMAANKAAAAIEIAARAPVMRDGMVKVKALKSCIVGEFRQVGDEFACEEKLAKKHVARGDLKEI